MQKFFLALGFLGTLFLLSRAFAGEPGGASDPLVTKSFLEESYAWHITTLLAGEKLRLEEGSELVLRSGKMIVIASPSGGVADLTIGQDLGNNILVPPDHDLLSPSGDGRGVQAVTTSVLMTRGVTR